MFYSFTFLDVFCLLMQLQCVLLLAVCLSFLYTAEEITVLWKILLSAFFQSQADVPRDVH